jgi:hypothetical protein
LIYSQLTLSKYFERSILRVMTFFLFVWMEWKPSWARPISWWICLPWRKKFFSIVMYSLRCSFNLLEIILHIIL